MADDDFERLIRAADSLGDYLVTLSQQDSRIRDDEVMHALVEELHSAVVAAKETHPRFS